MFNYKWFMLNDTDTVKRLTTVRDMRWYINDFIKDNKDVFDNMTLLNENIDDINRLYNFRKHLELATEKDLLKIYSEWIDLDKMNYIYAKRRGS